MKFPDLKSYISSLSNTKKVVIGFSVFLAIALLITGIALLIFFAKKSQDSNSSKSVASSNKNTGNANFGNANSENDTAEKVKYTGMLDMLKGLSDSSEKLSIEYQKIYKEGYSMSNESIISDALNDKLNNSIYYEKDGEVASVGSIIKGEYKQGYNYASGNIVQSLRIQVSVMLDNNGYFNRNHMNDKMLDIAKLSYDMGMNTYYASDEYKTKEYKKNGYSDAKNNLPKKKLDEKEYQIVYDKGWDEYYASDEYKNKVINDYTKMGYADASNGLPKKELEEEYQIAYNKGWDEFTDNWITNRAKIENEQKLAGILFSILGFEINMGIPLLYEKSFYDGYYMSNENILKEALAGNLNTLIVGYVYSGGISYVKGYVGKILLDDYAYAYNEGKRSLIDPSYRINGLRYDDPTYPVKFNTLRKMANDAGFAEAISVPFPPIVNTGNNMIPTSRNGTNSDSLGGGVILTY